MLRVWVLCGVLAATQVAVGNTRAQDLSHEFAPRLIKVAKNAEDDRIVPGKAHTIAVSADLDLTSGHWVVLATGTALHSNSAFRVCIDSKCDTQWGRGTGNDWDVQSQTAVFAINGDGNNRVALQVICMASGCQVRDRQITAIAFKQ